MTSPPLVAIGVDVSKGYADVVALNASGTFSSVQRFDDTPAGHAALREFLARWLNDPHCRLEVGLEASGGLERNWLHCFHSLLAGTSGRVYRLNALAVKRFRDRELHQNVTDALSAREIARYLHHGRRRGDVAYTEPQAGALTFYRVICGEIDRLAQLKNELQSLLPSVHPDLVQYCRYELPLWLLQVLQRYPTARQLGRAREATLARIPHVGPERARRLIAAAREGVGALQDQETGAAVALLVEQIAAYERRLDRLKAQLCASFATDEIVCRLTTIPGVGLWTAVQLRLEIGSFTRFETAAALIAFTGLDPRYHQSGDGRTEYRISKRGPGRVRAALFMATFAGLRHNPVLRAHFRRLKQRGKEGKVALVACMAKLLRIAYALIVSGRDFDPEYQQRLAAEHAAAQAAPAAAPAVTPAAAPGAPAVGAVSAPVSRREARQRAAARPDGWKAAAAPHAGSARQVRGRGAASVPHDTAGDAACPDAAAGKRHVTLAKEE